MECSREFSALGASPSHLPNRLDIKRYENSKVKTRKEESDDMKYNQYKEDLKFTISTSTSLNPVFTSNINNQA